MNRILWAAVVAAAMMALPFTLAHQGNTSPLQQLWGEPNLSCWSTQNPHDYATAVQDQSLRVITLGVAIDGSADSACPDGDGDHEFGYGGGMFPREKKPWHDPNYPGGFCELHPDFTEHHTGDHVEVIDATFTSGVVFWVGGDPSEPMIVPDGSGGYICVGDGCICPSLDADDWFYVCVDSCTIPAFATFPDPTTGLPLSRPTATDWTGRGIVYLHWDTVTTGHIHWTTPGGSERPLYAPAAGFIKIWHDNSNLHVITSYEGWTCDTEDLGAVTVRCEAPAVPAPFGGWSCLFVVVSAGATMGGSVNGEVDCPTGGSPGSPTSTGDVHGHATQSAATPVLTGITAFVCSANPVAGDSAPKPPYTVVCGDP